MLCNFMLQACHFFPIARATRFIQQSQIALGFVWILMLCSLSVILWHELERNIANTQHLPTRPAPEVLSSRTTICHKKPHARILISQSSMAPCMNQILYMKNGDTKSTYICTISTSVRKSCELRDYLFIYYPMSCLRVSVGI